MPYELYWRGPLSALLIYAEKARLESKREAEQENRVAWLHGAYITRAITSTFDGKKNPYPQRPIVPLTPEQEEKQQALEDRIAEHNAKMRKIREQSAIKLQRQLSEQMQINGEMQKSVMPEVESDVGTDH